jgi:hypothetical protein
LCKRRQHHKLGRSTISILCFNAGSAVTSFTQGSAAPCSDAMADVGVDCNVVAACSMLEEQRKQQQENSLTAPARMQKSKVAG